MSRYRKSNRYLTIDGETKLLVEWAEESRDESGRILVSEELIRDRLSRNWDPDLAVHTLPDKKHAKKT